MSNNFESIWTNSARLKKITKTNSKTFPVSLFSSSMATSCCRSRTSEIILILATLETVLIKIASNGEMPFDFEWKQISQLVKRKILFCIDSMNTKVKHATKNSTFSTSFQAQYQPAEEYTDSCDLLLQRMEMFTEAPFTIQRICELILEPEKYYKNTNKYIHALLKCLLVVSGNWHEIE